MVALIPLGLALGADVPVATQDIAPGTPITEARVRWVEVPDGSAMAKDALPNPVGHIVIERVLAGEILRAERLLDLEKPERIAVPGMRALRVPGVSRDAMPGRRADLWVAATPPCTWVQGAWILGLGRDMDGAPDSTWLLVSPSAALHVLTERAPMQIRAVSDATAARARPEIACSP